MNSKTCTKCNELLELSYFYKDKRNKDGLNTSCKKCDDIRNKNYYYNNREKVLELQKTKYLCECGGRYTYSHKNAHIQTKEHQLFLKNGPQPINPSKRKTIQCECGSSFRCDMKTRHIQTKKHQQFLQNEITI
jgi:hypothetical protein